MVNEEVGEAVRILEALLRASHPPANCSTPSSTLKLAFWVVKESTKLQWVKGCGHNYEGVLAVIMGFCV